MRLGELISGCPIVSVRGSLDTDVLGIAYDSREVSAAFAFVAIRGLNADGNRFVSQAIAKGARVIVSVLPPAPVSDVSDVSEVVWVQVAEDRRALAVMASNFYGRPTEALHMIGITGTNGKTTTTYVVESILQAAGYPAAVFGTIEYRGPGFSVSAERTTPEAPDLQALFRRVVDSGWKFAVMEVSSHSIELKRVDSMNFEVAVFTNLTRDHLDFHKDMRSYFLAKKKLFEGLDRPMPRVMVLNSDTPEFAELKAIAPSRAISYGLAPDADVHPFRYDFGWGSGVKRMNAVFRSPLGDLEVSSSLLGKPNLYNIGAAIGVSLALGLPADAVRQGITQLAGVPGRFEVIDAGQPFHIVVDYAHTDDALRRVLQSAREITKGRLIVVFGCGGDRDKTKRPLMGEAAALGSDMAVVTSDNPRSENPMEIIREVEVGLRKTGAVPGSDYFVFADRREAIRHALSSARDHDTVLLAGKGHESYQVIGHESTPFDDRVVARELLDELNAGRN